MKKYKISKKSNLEESIDIAIEGIVNSIKSSIVDKKRKVLEIMNSNN